MPAQGAILSAFAAMKKRYMGILPASVLLLGVCWWSRGAAVIERPADAARVSQQPVEWMEADMQAAATVLRLRLEHEHVQVNTQGFCHYNIVFHAVVEECVLGNIPVGPGCRWRRQISRNPLTRRRMRHSAPSGSWK